jgi:diacylglycerol kinase (ATP)
MLKKKTGLARVAYAAYYSWKGLKAAFCCEAAFRQELLLLLVALPVAFLLDITGLERLALLGVLVLVIIVELLNSAIEAVVDRIGTEMHELSGRAKDIGSAAVLVTLFLAAATWITICYPLFAAFFSTMA